MNIRTILVEKAIAAMTAAGLPEDTNPAVTQSTRPQFGDYQINGAMGAAKKRGAHGTAGRAQAAGLGRARAGAAGARRDAADLEGQHGAFRLKVFNCH